MEINEEKDIFYDEIKSLAGRSKYIIIPDKLGKIRGYDIGDEVKVIISIIKKNDKTKQ